MQLAHRVTLAPPALLGQLVLLVSEELMVTQEQLDRLALKETLVPLVHRVLRATQEAQALLVLLEPQVMMVEMVTLEPPAHRVILAGMETLEPQGLGDRQEELV